MMIMMMTHSQEDVGVGGMRRRRRRSATSSSSVVVSCWIQLIIVIVVLSLSLSSNSNPSYSSNNSCRIVVDAFHHTSFGLLRRTRQNILTTQLNVIDPTTNNNPSHQAASSSETNNEGDDDLFLSDERKATLFQFLLRDLEVEGVPLLGCDATQVPTFLTAVFTTMAEISSVVMENNNNNNNSTKVCLVLEDIPMLHLHQFVNEFHSIQSTTRLMESVPELQLFNISLIGKGLVGPALIIETSPSKSSEQSDIVEMDPMNVDRWTTAQKSFVGRMIEGSPDGGVWIPPHQPKQPQETEEGDENVPPIPIAYRFATSSNICDILSGFWNSICELQITSSDDIGSIMLCYPPSNTTASSTSEVVTVDAGTRYTAIAEILNRILALFPSNNNDNDDDDDDVTVVGGDGYQLVHVNPVYDCDLIYPPQNPQQPFDDDDDGHLPPTSWLRSMMDVVTSANSDDEEPNMVILSSDQDLSIQNYQRRSPLPAVLIDRRKSLSSSTNNGIKGDEVTQIVVDGLPHMVYGFQTYTRNVRKLLTIGEDTLKDALAQEMNMLQ